MTLKKFVTIWIPVMLFSFSGAWFLRCLFDDNHTHQVNFAIGVMILAIGIRTVLGPYFKELDLY